MWSKYKFYFIGVAVLGVAAILYYRKKNKAEEKAEEQTEALINTSHSDESQKNIAKSLAYIAN